MLGNSRSGITKALSLGNGERGNVAVLVVGLLFERSAVASFKLFPTAAKYRLSRCRKLGIGTTEHGFYRFVGMRCGGRKKQTRSDKR